MKFLTWLWNKITQRWRGRHGGAVDVPAVTHSVNQWLKQGMEWTPPWATENKWKRWIYATLSLEMKRIRNRHFDSPNARARKARLRNAANHP